MCAKGAHLLYGSKRYSPSRNVSKSSGQSHLAKFMAELRTCGYASQVLEMCHSAFVGQKRPRIFSIACSDAAGGVAGAQWIAQAAKKTLHEITKFPAADIWDVVDVNSATELHYKSLIQVRICCTRLAVALESCTQS